MTMQQKAVQQKMKSLFNLQCGLQFSDDDCVLRGVMDCLQDRYPWVNVEHLHDVNLLHDAPDVSSDIACAATLPDDLGTVLATGLLRQAMEERSECTPAGERRQHRRQSEMLRS